MTTMSFDETPEFRKECKRLARKYKSLSEDLQEFCNVLTVIPLGNSKHFTILTKNEVLYIIKARLFCRYLKGSSLRIVYAYFQREQRIEFIEIYYKGTKNNEDYDRIKKYVEKHQV